MMQKKQTEQNSFLRFVGSKIGFLLIWFFLFCLCILFCLITDHNLLSEKYWGTEYSLCFLYPFAPLYLIDYRAGFVSRALIGSVIALFTETVTNELILTVSICAVAVSFLLQSMFAAFVLRKALLERNYFMAGLVVVFSFLPFTVLENAAFVGLLDVFNYILFLAYLLIPNRKLLFAFSPVLIFVGMTVHYQFSAAFLPGIFLLLIYYTYQEKQPGDAAFCRRFLIIDAVVSLLSIVYFVFMAKYAARLSSDELNTLMEAKYTGDLYKDYFNFYIYAQFDGVSYSTPLQYLLFLIRYRMDLVDPSAYLYYFFMSAPLYALFEVIWIRKIKREKKGSRYPYLFFALYPLTLVPTLIISSDLWRWVSYNIIVMFILLFSVYKTDKEFAEELRSDFAGLVSTRPRIAVTVILVAVYLVCGILFGKADIMYD